jgi:hypothetical protein
MHGNPERRKEAWMAGTRGEERQPMLQEDSGINILFVETGDQN